MNQTVRPVLYHIERKITNHLEYKIIVGRDLQDKESIKKCKEI